MNRQQLEDLLALQFFFASKYGIKLHIVDDTERGITFMPSDTLIFEKKEKRISKELDGLKSNIYIDGNTLILSFNKTTDNVPPSWYNYREDEL